MNTLDLRFGRPPCLSNSVRLQDANTTTTTFLDLSSLGSKAPLLLGLNYVIVRRQSIKHER